MIGRVAERLQEKFDAGEIGFFGQNPAKSTIRVAPTYLITDSRKLDEFSEGLLPDLKPNYRLSSVGSILYWVHGLSYPLLRFKEASVWVLPDYQLAENMSNWETGVGVQYSRTALLEGLTRGLDKKQLAALIEDPVRFNQRVRNEIEFIKRNPPNFSFIPPEGFRRQVIPGVRLI